MVPRGSYTQAAPGGEARVRRVASHCVAALWGRYEHSPKHAIGGPLTDTHMRGRRNDPGPRFS